MFAGSVVVYPQNRWVSWFSHKAKTEGSAGGGGITELAINGSKIAANACTSDGNIHFLTKVPLRGVYLLFKL
jgi:hypothetical protein